MPKLRFTENAKADLLRLQIEPSQARILKDVRKTLGLMETNLRHPSLCTHEYKNFSGPNDEKVFEAYAQQKTPGAYRIFWYYRVRRNLPSWKAWISEGWMAQREI